MSSEITRRVDAPPARVWDVLADVASWPTWTASVTSVELLDEGPMRVGWRVRMAQPRLPTSVWTVTEVEVGRSFTWQARGPGRLTTATHRIEPAAQGSTVVLGVRQEGPVGLVVGRLARSLTERYMALEADGLARRAEGRAHPPG